MKKNFLLTQVTTKKKDGHVLHVAVEEYYGNIMDQFKIGKEGVVTKKLIKHEMKNGNLKYRLLAVESV